MKKRILHYVFVPEIKRDEFCEYCKYNLDRIKYAWIAVIGFGLLLILTELFLGSIIL